jgi:hypothetical protein
VPVPNANVDLVQVTAARDTGEDWDDADTPGAELWHGASGAYLRENEDRVRTGQEGNVVIRRTLHLAPNDPRLPWEAQQVVHWRDRRTGTLGQGTVQGVGRPSPPPGFGSVGSVQLILDPA